LNDSIKLIIDGYVDSDSIFNTRLSIARYLGQITSGDSLIKIISWNLILHSSPGRYYCYLIRREENSIENRIYRLTADYNALPERTDTVYSQADWYGALYYDIRPFNTDEGVCWILLGIDYGNLLISRKIIDVVNFTPSGSIIFGKKWFAEGDRIKFREVFEYASEGTMTLRFSSDTSMVFDHLVPFSPALKADRQFYGPDYSYDAYLFKNGLWNLTINVDARNKE
jgi:hypothetical protein